MASLLACHLPLSLIHHCWHRGILALSKIIYLIVPSASSSDNSAYVSSTIAYYSLRTRRSIPRSRMIGRNACAVSLALVLCHCILRCGGNCACPTADKRPWDATLPGPLHEFALPWANQHPLNEDMVRRARAHVGDSSALRRVLCKAASGQTLHVVVVGLQASWSS